MEDNPEDRGKFFIAAMNGDIGFFEEARKKEIENCDEDYFLRQTTTDKFNILHIAIQYGKDELIEKIVKGELLPRAVTNQLIYQQDEHGNNPLHAAEEEGNIKFLELLLQWEEGEQEVKVLRPAPVISRLQNNDGNTPLHVALVKRNLNVAKLLVKHFPDLTGVTNNEGNTPFHVAAALGNPDIFMLLYAENEHSQETCGLKNKRGNTALHVASTNGCFRIAQFLLQRDPKLANVSNHSGETPLHLAIMKHQIIEKKIEDEENSAENISLEYETNRDSSVPNAKEKVETRNTKHNYSVGGNSSRSVQQDKHVDMNTEMLPVYGMDPNLEKAAEQGNVKFLKDARNKKIENYCQYFMGQNYSEENNILHIAVQFKQHDFIEEVTEKRLLPRSIINKLMSQRNNDGNTPLHVAAAKVDNVPIFKLLLKCEKGQYDIKNKNGCTPFHVALINNNFEIASSLVNKHDDLVEEADSISITNTSSLIELLVQKESVACLKDNEGYTPLHRAAFVTTSFGLHVIGIILKNCPESATVVDDKNGETILHLMINRISSYKNGKELLQIREIQGLKNKSNKRGKTPLKLALKLNFKMVRLLINELPEVDADEGSSTSDLERQLGLDKENAKAGITSHERLRHFDKMIKEKKKMTIEEYGVVDGVKFQLLQDIYSTFGMDFLLSRDSKGRNVLHNLMQLERGSPIVPEKYLDFVKQVVDNNPTLVFLLDFNRNTPLHILLQNSHDTKIQRFTTQHQQSPQDHHNYDYNTLHNSTLPFELLNLCCNYAKVVAGEDCCNFKYDSPWLVQNVDGNTPLHEALKANHILPLFSRDILSDLPIITKLSNKCKETPLHLLAGNPFVEWSEDVICAIATYNQEATTRKDKDGLTPIMRAVQVGHINTVKILDSLKPEASKIVDNDGQTIWHMLVNQPSSMTQVLFEDIEKKQHLIKLLKEVDNKGKTPLHLALESRHFTHARLFLQCSSRVDELSLSKDALDWIMVLLEIKDGDGVTPGDLLASIQDLPQPLEKLLSRYPDKLQGYRSGYGISTKEMNEYVNTMGVIAALLATISFTAAFTVPGGVIQEDKDKNVIGSPLLVDVVAFQAFMFFDISTMCLSTMVLFCLLWILAADTKRKSVMLMDFSILLLLISFYTTLLTFMTGVYVTTIHVKPWIAIYTLVICTTLLLLMHKYIVIEYLGPFGSTLSTSVSKFIRRITNQENKNKEEISGDVSPTHTPPTETEK